MAAMPEPIRSAAAAVAAMALAFAAAPAAHAAKEQQHRGMRVRVAAHDPRRRDDGLQAEFLVQLARERLRDRLAGLELAAGELPPAGVRLAGDTLPDEHRAIVAQHHADGDVDDAR